MQSKMAKKYCFEMEWRADKEVFRKNTVEKINFNYQFLPIKSSKDLCERHNWPECRSPILSNMG
jgi:hypothetical protein